MKEWGYELIIDLKKCDINVISSKGKLQSYVDNLCNLIDMKKYGFTQMPYFGLNCAQTKGFSLLQFIETSSITGHFSEYNKSAYINIFSCKLFDPKETSLFTKKFFGAKSIKSKFLRR